MQSEINIIVENWANDQYIDILIYQQPSFNKMMESIYNLVEKLESKDKYIVDCDLLKLTKPLNNILYEKYGLDGILIGLKNLTKSKNYVETIKTNKCIAKGVFKEKYRTQILKSL